MEKLISIKVKMFILIIGLIVITKANLRSQDYVYVGKDSIQIINSMMEYHLDNIKDSLEFESITFEQKKERKYSLRQLYDSLSKIYLPYKFNLISGSTYYDGSLNSQMFFLVDSITIYTLWVFIPDSLYLKSKLRGITGKRSYKINKDLLEFKDFGILAFKDKKHIKKLNQNYKKDPSYLNDHPFYQEYLKLLKKKYGKQKDKKNKK